jgi:hypothetical protein
MRYFLAKQSLLTANGGLLDKLGFGVGVGHGDSMLITYKFN